jgi:hypothetical protein
VILAAWVWVIAVMAAYLVQFAPLADLLLRRVIGS